MEYNLAQIRTLITEAYDDEELTIFCSDHFREVVDRFGSGTGKREKAFLLVEYCYRHEALDTLLKKVKAERSQKYEMYRAQLTSEDYPSPSAAQTRPRQDVYTAYETGLGKLLARIGPDHPKYSEVLVYQQRLFEGIAQARRYGDTETIRAERSRVIDRLNEISVSALGTAFNKLCDMP